MKPIVDAHTLDELSVSKEKEDGIVKWSKIMGKTMKNNVEDMYKNRKAHNYRDEEN